MDFEVIRDSALLVLMFLVFGIPALAIAARIAMRPVIEAITRLREVGAPRTDPRLASLEAEVSRLSTEVQRLREAETFTRELREGGSP
jgi:hypothetical protein